RAARLTMKIRSGSARNRGRRGQAREYGDPICSVVRSNSALNARLPSDLDTGRSRGRHSQILIGPFWIGSTIPERQCYSVRSEWPGAVDRGSRLSNTERHDYSVDHVTTSRVVG